MELKIDIPEVTFSDETVNFISEETAKLAELREGLEFHKNSLDDRVVADRDNILSKFNPFFYERYEIAKIVTAKLPRENIDSEKSKINISWLKIYEIICKYQVFPKDKEKLVFFDCAGLPGHTIFAAEYYVTKIMKKEFDYFACVSTINKQHSDRFDILLKDKRDKASKGGRWVTGGTTGDPSSIDCIEIASRLLAKKDVYIDFFFGDYAMDFSHDYSRQEETYMPFITGEMMMAIRNMRVGSSMCLKQFSTFDKYTISCICALSQLFESFYIYKPHSSKQQNSEIYLIGLNYRHIGNLCRNDAECCDTNNCKPMKNLYTRLKKCLVDGKFDAFVGEETIKDFINRHFDFFENLYVKQMEKLEEIISVLDTKNFDKMDKRSRLELIKKKNSLSPVREFHKICTLR